MLREDVWTILNWGPERATRGAGADRSLGRPMLEQALRCALEVSRPERLVIPLLESEEPWWGSAVADLPQTARLAQPFDRGSGIGLLVALVRIAKVDREAPVVLLSAENVCGQPEALAEEGLARLAKAPHRIHLVGPTKVVVARASVLLAAFEHVRPDVVDQCLDVLGPASEAANDALDSLYPFVDALDFHHEVLAAVPERLAR